MTPTFRAMIDLLEAPTKLNLVHLLVLSKVIEQNGSYPAKVGEACGIHYQKAGSWGASRLNSLERQGLVARRAPDENYVTATPAGIAFYEQHKSELEAAGEWLPMRNAFRNLLSN